MAVNGFSLEYSGFESVEFSNSNEARKYISQEIEAWRGFSESFQENTDFKGIWISSSQREHSTIVKNLENLKKIVGDPPTFIGYRRNILVPPPSISLEGQLILGLCINGRNHEASCAFLRFLVNSDQAWVNSGDNRLKLYEETGERLNIAAYAASALPFQRVSTQKLTGARRSAENLVKYLRGTVREAQDINSAHETELSKYRERSESYFKRLLSVFFRRERRRQSKHDAWVEAGQQRVDDAFAKAETRLNALDQVNKDRQAKRESEHRELIDRFHQQLKLRAPVTLWEQRAKEHERKQKSAFRAFCSLAVVAGGIGTLIPFFAGDYIASSFFTEVCLKNAPAECARQVSAKGPLTVAGLLVVVSVFLWMIRLQYKVHLSERHLALDASEKMAFAQTFLALKEKDGVTDDNETIVLSALFRPTQDGIIKDDDGGLDVSVAAILAKQLGKT